MAPSQRLRNVRVAWFASVLRVPSTCIVGSRFRVRKRGAAGTPPCEQMNCSTPGALPGRTMARIGLRMMPPFPSSSLSFRTAGFPQYGWKAGISDGACPFDYEFFASCGFASALRALRCLQPIRVLSRGAAVRRCTPCKRPVPLYPRGPRSGPGYVVPVHHHLLTPCAPLAGTSRFHGHRLYEMPSLCVHCDA